MKDLRTQRERYDDYRFHCIEDLGVHPASFAIWAQIEPWLIEHKRIAVLDPFCGWQRESKWEKREAERREMLAV